jgi:hypothetical protein
MIEEPPPTTASELEHLHATLEEALGLTRELTEDRQLARLFKVFRAMPAEDRPAILEALEREVAARKLSLATESMSGQSMTPNRHARLYVRAHETSLDRNVFESDEMMIATVRGMRAATLIPAIPEIYASWQSATREAMEQVDQATRTTVEGLVREILGFLVEARALDDGDGATSPVTPDSSDKEAQRS